MLIVTAGIITGSTLLLYQPATGLKHGDEIRYKSSGIESTRNPWVWAGASSVGVVAGIAIGLWRRTDPADSNR